MLPCVIVNGEMYCVSGELYRVSGGRAGDEGEEGD